MKNWSEKNLFFKNVMIIYILLQVQTIFYSTCKGKKYTKYIKQFIGIYRRVYTKMNLK